MSWLKLKECPKRFTFKHVQITRKKINRWSCKRLLDFNYQMWSWVWKKLTLYWSWNFSKINCQKLWYEWKASQISICKNWWFRRGCPVIKIHTKNNGQFFHQKERKITFNNRKIFQLFEKNITNKRQQF